MAKKKDLTNQELFEKIEKELRKYAPQSVPVPYVLPQVMHCTCCHCYPAYPYSSPYYTIISSGTSNAIPAGQTNISLGFHSAGLNNI